MVDPETVVLDFLEVCGLTAIASPRLLGNWCPELVYQQSRTGARRGRLRCASPFIAASERRLTVFAPWAIEPSLASPELTSHVHTTCTKFADSHRRMFSVLLPIFAASLGNRAPQALSRRFRLEAS